MTRTCSKCHVCKPIGAFSFRNRTRGSRRYQCKACDAADKAAYLATPQGAVKQRTYRLSTRERIRELERRRRAANAEKKREQDRRRRQSDAAKQQRREYLARPEVRARVNELRRARKAERYRSSVTEQLNNRMSCLIRRSLQTRKNNRSWRSLVDYDVAELRGHLERQFTSGMSWDRFLRGEIHIDHIRPLASFDFTSAEDLAFARCWALTNLRPLWAPDNRRKRDRMEFLV